MQLNCIIHIKFNSKNTLFANKWSWNWLESCYRSKIGKFIVVLNYIGSKIVSSKIEMPQLCLTPLGTFSARHGSAWEISARTQHQATIRDEFKLEFSGSSEPELWKFRAELEHINFRSGTELTILTICMSKNHNFVPLLPI